MDADPGRLSLTTQLLILLALTLVNAFYAASEMALVSLSKAKMKAIAENTSDGDGRAEKVLLLLEDSNAFLSAIQVAITFAGFLSSAFASFNMSSELAGFFAERGIYIHEQAAVVIVTLILSYFTLVLGELLPKSLAMRDPEGFAITCVGVISLTKKLFKPFVALLSFSVNCLQKLFKDNTPEDEEDLVKEEIMNIVEEQAELDESGKEMISSILEFDDAFAYEVMIPRTDVFMLDINDPVSTFSDELLESRHSKVPFFADDQDDIVGVLNVSDYVLEAKKHGFDNVDIRSILKQPYFVPESKKINDLLKELQARKQSMAVLIDEYGGFSGIVTIEDILEEIVGNIEDEYQEPEPGIRLMEDGSYIIDGLYDLEDLEEELGIRLESENNETLSGFLMEISGKVPSESSVGKELLFENCIFKILSVSDRRIDQVSLTITDAEKDTSDEE